MTKAPSMKFFSILALAWCVSSAIAASVQFDPRAGVTTVIDVRGSEITLKTSTGSNVMEQKIHFETERPLNLVIDDFDFDGTIDFSAWSLDEGKGVFEMHRVFLYDAAHSTFKEAFPKCGDEFMNLRVDHPNKVLVSTYFRDGAPATCHSIGAFLQGAMPWRLLKARAAKIWTRPLRAVGFD